MGKFYQPTALLLPGTALIFSSLIALMKDQVDSLALTTISTPDVPANLKLASAGESGVVSAAI